MDGHLSLPLTTGPEGQFSTTFSFGDLSALVDSSCRASGIGLSDVSSLTIYAYTPADEKTCALFCSGEERSASCVKDCTSDERKIFGVRSFGRGELAAATFPSENQQVSLQTDITISRLSGGIRQTHGPDLTVDPISSKESLRLERMTFDPDSCSLEEKCVMGPGSRRLLRFDGAIENLGDQDFILGAPEQQPDLFAYSACHGHYHLNETMKYELLYPQTLQPVEISGQRIVGHKQGFCMIDMRQVAGSQAAKYTCEYQGLTSGWNDIYPSSLECQWLDVTDVPPGSYVIRISVNPEGTLLEADRTNNSADIPVIIPQE
jgi:hypothetical protein